MSAISILDSRIRQLGRWNIQGDGIWSGWGGSQLKFVLTGTNSLTVNASVTRPAGTVCYCECVIDNSPENAILKSFVNGQVVFDMPDTNEHSIVIKTNGYRADIFNQVSKSVLLSLEIDNEGAILAQEHAPLLLQCVGDSWMAADNDWPRLMRPDMFDTYQIATGGMTCANANTDYIYNANGILADDLQADAVIVSFGVNDFNAGISVASFQSSLSSLIAKIQGFQSCPIFLVQVPRNVNTGKNFDQYGAAMQAVSGGNVYYVPTGDLNYSVTWQADTYHLAPQGKVLLADYVGEFIVNAMNIRKDFLRIKGMSFEGENVITNKHQLRYKGSFEFGSTLKPIVSDSALRVMVNGQKYTLG